VSPIPGFRARLSSFADESIPQSRAIKRLLIANRGEIAIRVMRAAAELGMHRRDSFSGGRFSLHRTKADESYLVARARADRSLPRHRRHHPGRDEARVDASTGIWIFVGESGIRGKLRRRWNRVRSPLPDTMRASQQGRARNLAASVGVPVMPATPPLPETSSGFSQWPRVSAGHAQASGAAARMRIVEEDAAHRDGCRRAREAKAAFGRMRFISRS